MSRRPFAFLLTATAWLASACGGGETGDGAGTTSTPAGRTGRTVEVIDNAYVPVERAVTAGTEVIWRQTGTAAHTVTAADGSFDSHPSCPNVPDSCMGSGDTYAHTFDRPGRFAYACKVHGEPMSGTIVVE